MHVYRWIPLAALAKLQTWRLQCQVGLHEQQAVCTEAQCSRPERSSTLRSVRQSPFSAAASLSAENSDISSCYEAFSLDSKDVAGYHPFVANFKASSRIVPRDPTCSLWWVPFPPACCEGMCSCCSSGATVSDPEERQMPRAQRPAANGFMVWESLRLFWLL